MSGVLSSLVALTTFGEVGPWETFAKKICECTLAVEAQGEGIS
jgi:hypothetical protein